MRNITTISSEISRTIKTKHYVYAHFCVEEKMFYIGMGKDKRPWSTANRNDDWWAKVLVDNVVHFEVEILAENLTAKEARIFEKAYIESYGLGSLANRQH